MRRAMLLSLVLAGCEPGRGVKMHYSSGAESLSVAQKRIGKMRIKYARVEAEGQGLLVTLPGASPEEVMRVKELLGTSAKLELTFVCDGEARVREGELLPLGLELTSDRYGSPAIHLEGPTRAAVEGALGKVEFPKGRVIVSAEEKALFRTWVLEEKPVVTNDAIADAKVAIEPASGQPEVNLTFTPAGSKAFADATGAGIGRRIAILLDGQVQSAPVVQDRITGGNARITLGRGKPLGELLKDADRLALVLKSGEMPVVPVLASQEAYPPK